MVGLLNLGDHQPIPWQQIQNSIIKEVNSALDKYFLGEFRFVFKCSLFQQYLPSIPLSF